MRTLGSCFPNKAILKVHVNLRIYIQENNLLIFYSTIKNTKKKKVQKELKLVKKIHTFSKSFNL